MRSNGTTEGESLAPEGVLALIGLRCSGKTRLGRALAEFAGTPFVDLDDELEPGSSRGAGELLAEVGEARFREIEARALERVLEREPPFVLATGGGAIERAASRVLLAERAICLWLRADPHVLAARLSGDSALRPPLAGGGPLEEVALLAARRDPLYAGIARAELWSDRAGVPELAARALDAWRGAAG